MSVYIITIIVLSVIAGMLMMRRFMLWQLAKQMPAEVEVVQPLEYQAIMNEIMDAMRCGYKARDMGLRIMWHKDVNEAGEEELYARFYEETKRFGKVSQINHYFWRVGHSAEAVVDQYPEPVMKIEPQKQQPKLYEPNTDEVPEWAL